eukprot:TRINITY_DN60570_c0_g1_i2.p1 TRINITY_DN60570_c0_g1~~TRINITY_DN60570_c0_g1_i2.p1  ORF type:complete len:261 (-),score=20.93 TRINITY_DN60570_c0_g1_i2:607-1389(-)
MLENCKEIEIVCKFFSNKISNSVDREKINKFSELMESGLSEKYEGHWYENSPRRGQAYRTILFDPTGFVDCVIQKALKESGIVTNEVDDFKSLFPTLKNKPLQVWVDPMCVEVEYLKAKTTTVLYQHPAQTTTTQVVAPKPVTHSPPRSLSPVQQQSRVSPNLETMGNYYSPPASPPSTFGDNMYYQAPQNAYSPPQQQPVYYTRETTSPVYFHETNNTSPVFYPSNSPVYYNDFSCRTEAYPQQSNNWMSYEYSTYVHN